MALMTFKTSPVGQEDGGDSPYHDIYHIIAGSAGGWVHPEGASAATETYDFEVPREFARRIVAFADFYLDGSNEWYNCMMFAHEVTTGDRVDEIDARAHANSITEQGRMIGPCPATGQLGVIGLGGPDGGAFHAAVGLGEGYCIQIDRIMGRLRLAQCDALLDYYRITHHPGLRLYLPV